LILRDLPGFLAQPLSLDQAIVALRDGLRHRETNFLKLAERKIFGYARSPYRPLLEHAGCSYEDLRRSVLHDGLEPALQKLHAAGVHITYEEFKGRTPIVRAGRVFRVKPQDFDNPHLTKHYEVESGGTTGRSTVTPIDLAHLRAQAPHFMLAMHAYGVRDTPAAVWRGILPDSSGINNVLRMTLCGNPPRRWFSQLGPGDVRLTRLKTDIATKLMVAVARRSGAAIPWPETVPIERADIVARWAAATLSAHGACLILTQVSRALRVCLAAREQGTSLEGATFLVGGEPPTPAKVSQITASGARCFPGYGFSEASGRFATGCACPIGPNDLHLDSDAIAVFTSPRKVPFNGDTVPAFYFTTLLSSAPKVMLNVENDDYGVIETRGCGCPIGEMGYTQHIRDIRSFSKLTGEGVTLIGSEMIAILEHVLPTRFGGSALDFQLREEEDERGFTRLTLLVSPHLNIPDDRLVLDVMWESLRASSVGADLARDMWKRAGTMRVLRTPPVWTERGKLMPLHLSSRTSRPVSDA
jgi:hypothetical protein